MKFLEIESTPSLPAPKLSVHDIKPLSAPPPRRSSTAASSTAAGEDPFWEDNRLQLFFLSLSCALLVMSDLIKPYLTLSLLPHRSWRSQQASRRVQSFPGASLRRRAPTGRFRSRRFRRSPADEAHLGRPAHLHAGAGGGGGQCWSCAQRLVEAVTSSVSSDSSTPHRPRDERSPAAPLSFPKKINHQRIQRFIVPFRQRGTKSIPPSLI